jgi:hypothetical protein
MFATIMMPYRFSRGPCFGRHKRTFTSHRKIEIIVMVIKLINSDEHTFMILGFSPLLPGVSSFSQSLIVD